MELDLGTRHKLLFLVPCHQGRPLLAPDRRGDLLAVLFLEQWLRIEDVHVGRSAHHKEIDDVLGPGGKVRGGEDAGVPGAAEERGVHQAGEGGRTQSTRRACEEVAPGESVIKRVGQHVRHCFLLAVIPV